MIEVTELTKRYGRTVALDGLSFTVRPGRVTGFLGPNGAGKSTTMRILLGLDRPDSGTATIEGRRYCESHRPLHQVGALLDATALPAGRSALDHLRWQARSNRIPQRRVVELLEEVGLAGVAHQRVGGYSLGMKQRLGIAAALLGDPPVLLLDEPVNGLDPDGVRWIRQLLRSLAGQGRTVLLSSHLMSEMALTADQIVIIGRGRLIVDTSVAELTERFRRGVLVRSPGETELAGLLIKAGAEVELEPGGGLTVSGLEPSAIGELAALHGIALHEVTPRSASLEETYLALTASSIEYSGGTSQ
ncbi:MAG: ABC transporter ATP-binding protein [Micromonosporaceae bacterium]|nr:ABC transporter ATP-binding protein [Micromonosporaceae bacterium]